MGERRGAGGPQHGLLNSLLVTHLTHQRTLLALELVLVVAGVGVVHVYAARVGLVVLVLDLHAVPCTERNVLFNHALNTFYLQLYGVGHMVKDHSDSEKEKCFI